MELLNPIELSKMLKRNGMKNFKSSEELINYIDNLHKALLGYQGFINTLKHSIETHDVNITMY